MKNRLFKLGILLTLVLSFYIFVILRVNVGCFFKEVFGIRCVSCGLTRAFISIIHFEFINALKYNILSILIFVFLSIFSVLLIIDIILNRNMSFNLIKYLSRYYILMIILVIVTTVINNINKI